MAISEPHDSGLFNGGIKVGRISHIITGNITKVPIRSIKITRFFLIGFAKLTALIQKMAEPVLAHRLVLSPEARMRNMTAQRVLANVLSAVQVPVKAR